MKKRGIKNTVRNCINGELETCQGRWNSVILSRLLMLFRRFKFTWWPHFINGCHQNYVFYCQLLIWFINCFQSVKFNKKRIVPWSLLFLRKFWSQAKFSMIINTGTYWRRLKSAFDVYIFYHLYLKIFCNFSDKHRGGSHPCAPTEDSIHWMLGQKSY